MSDLPDPLVPPEVDLRGYEFMPYYGDRLRDSNLNSRATDAEYRAAHNLWWSSWKQVPAASLPDDDVQLARLADLGRDLKTWKKVRAGALAGFVKCSDGRLYHRVLAPLAIEAWKFRSSQTKKARSRWGLKTAESFDMFGDDRATRLASARSRGAHTKEQWIALKAFCGDKCAKCGATDREIVKDHILPIFKGGSDSIQNLQPLCHSCNSAKAGDQTDYRPSGWREYVDQQAPPGTPAGTPAAAPIIEGKTPAGTPTRIGQERIGEDKTPRPPINGEDEFVLPSSIDPKIWTAFEQHRKEAVKVPLTDLARKLTVEKLIEYERAGDDPNAVLKQSIELGYRGVFPLKGAAKNGMSNREEAAAAVRKEVERKLSGGS